MECWNGVLEWSIGMECEWSWNGVLEWSCGMECGMENIGRGLETAEERKLPGRGPGFNRLQDHAAVFVELAYNLPCEGTKLL